MSLKKVQIIVWSILAGAVLSVLVGSATENLFFAGLAFVLLIACAVFDFVKWRWPYCGEHLGRDVKRYCTHCGKKLDDLQ